MTIFDWLDMVAVTSLSAFVNGVLIGTLLCLAVWGMVRLMSNWIPINATTRFFVWMTLFVVCIGLVGWQGWARLDAEVADAPPAPMQAVEAPASMAPPSVRPAIPAAPAAIPVQEPAPAPALPEQISADETAYVNEAVVTWNVPRQIEIAGLSAGWRVLLFTVWITVAFMLLLRVIRGWYGVAQLKKSSYPAPVRVQELLQKTLLQISQPRKVQVAISDDIATAVAVGYWRPRILLPAGMVASLSQTELQQVLLHEAAHLQRLDDWTMLLQRMATALLFFHPGLVLLGKLMDRDREYACDDWVIALTRRPKTYASCLAKLVSQYARQHPPAFVPGFSSDKEALFDRIKSILDKKRSISFRISRVAYTGLLAATLAVLLLMVRFVPVVALPAQHAIVHTPSDIETMLPLAVPEQSDDDPLLAVLPEDDRVPATGPVATLPEDSVMPVLPPVAVVPGVADMAAHNVVDMDALATGFQDNNTFASIDGAPAEVAFGVAVTDIPLENLPVPQQPVQQRDDEASLSARSMAKILRAASRIPSSGDRAQVLLNAVKKMQFDAVVFDAFLETVASIPSSGDKARVLLALVDYQQLDEVSALQFLRVASLISSSSDKSRVLLRSLKGDSLPLQKEAVQDGFLDAIGHLGSPDDYRKVLKAFMSHRQSVDG